LLHVNLHLKHCKHTTTTTNLGLTNKADHWQLTTDHWSVIF